MSRGYASLTQNVDYGGVAEAARFQPMRSVTTEGSLTGYLTLVRIRFIIATKKGEEAVSKQYHTVEDMAKELEVSDITEPGGQT